MVSWRSFYINRLIILLITIVVNIKTLECMANEDDLWQSKHTNWHDIDAWARERSDQLCSCPCEKQSGILNEYKKKLIGSEDNIASLVYYKKLITLVFNRNELSYDENSQIFQRSIVLSIEQSQLEKLEKLQDPRDLDILLMQIFENVQKVDKANECYEHPQTDWSFNYFWQIFNMSEVRFLLMFICYLLCCWYIHRHWNINWFWLLFGSIFLSGFLFTYMECNRELEISELHKVIQQQRELVANKEEKYIFLQNFMKWFSSDDRQTDNEYEILKKTSASSKLLYCRPDRVFVRYISEIFLNYIQGLLEQTSNTLSDITASMPFPYNIFAAPLLVALMAYMLHLIFKHILSPKAWFHIINYRSFRYKSSNQNDTSHAIAEDRISGENLKFLLNTLSSSSKIIAHSVSGVEEIKELDSGSNLNAITYSMKKNQYNGPVSVISNANELSIMNNLNSNKKNIKSNDKEVNIVQKIDTDSPSHSEVTKG